MQSTVVMKKRDLVRRALLQITHMRGTPDREVAELIWKARKQTRVPDLDIQFGHLIRSPFRKQYRPFRDVFGASVGVDWYTHYIKKRTATLKELCCLIIINP